MARRSSSASRAGEVGDDHGHLAAPVPGRAGRRGCVRRIGLEAGRGCSRSASRAVAAVEVGVDELADDGAGADDGDLDDRCRRSMRGFMRGRVAIWARLSIWKTPMVSARCIMAIGRRVVLGDAGRGRRRAPCRGCCRVSMVSWIAAIMPSPSRSTLMMPRSSQSSLSHWTTRRPGMEAFSSGTTVSRPRSEMIMPPECWPRWRGRR